MKKGFTLAEVLITLAVIGVVAALTIPVLIQKYQKKQLYSQFMKAYNTISTMMDNAVAENGDIQDWKWGDRRYNNQGEEYIYGSEDPISKYVLPQIKYVKKCDKMSDCFGTGYTFLNGKDGSSEMYPDDNLTSDMSSYDDEENTATIVLADGSVIMISGNKWGIYFVVDTNGKKGPNVVGRDLFEIWYDNDDVMYGKDSVGKIEIEEWEPNGFYGNNCDPNNSNDWDSSDGCASRLLQEGAMNY